MDSDDLLSYRRVLWDGTNLHLHDGDEIEIRRGIIAKKGHDYDIRASVIANLSTRIGFRSLIERATVPSPPRDFDPPICGCVENIEVAPEKITFDIVEKDYRFRHH